MILTTFPNRLALKKYDYLHMKHVLGHAWLIRAGFPVSLVYRFPTYTGRQAITAGDWLQGPHLYTLYNSYNFSKHQIELLFVVGFSSALIFGTTIGSFADKLGRRLNCVLYGIFYTICCVTKHYNNFFVLACGCILGGVSTSILFSAFESWLIHDFNRQNIDKNLLGNIFSTSVLCNSIVAILMGLVSQLAVDTFGYTAPFKIAACSFFLMIIYLTWNWEENYGSQETSVCLSLRNSFQLIKSDYKVLCLGMIQSLFEGSMYVFVLEWTPSLNYASGFLGFDLILPYGLIFSIFMLCVMTGSYIFKILSQKLSVESFMRFVLLISAVALMVPLIFRQVSSVILFWFFSLYHFIFSYFHNMCNELPLYW
ncbi:molybdate-anion transporter [Octopus bimaculoides]|uniref:molybdate-anion transporter n=1 Tax=Octopus bimaculoides TaxID=37653 RepID=UPI00071C7977|nr:molybdate-anion transporter [Octopus bimaculoides]|eukprot:XP_014785804.1 PREDICTED: molybdate-anion transporter-like [Octopus bimaculoides]